MSAYWYDACLPVLCLLACVLSGVYVMSAYLYGFCLLACIMSSNLYYDCSAEWHLSNLYDVCLPVLYLGSCTYNICLSLSVWYLTPCIMYGFFIFDAWLSVQCLGTWMMSAYLYYVCLLVWCLSTCMMSAYLFYLPTCIMSAQLYKNCLAVWRLLIFVISCYLYAYLWCLATCMIQCLAIFKSS
jgi:hypothetical protein